MGERGSRGARALDYSKLDGLVPVVVVDALSKRVLMQAYASREALGKTLETRYAWFYSRSRRRLWMKGEASGNTMRVLRVVGDCDMDSVLYEVLPGGPACHTGRRSCFHNTIADWRRETMWGLLVEAFSEAVVVVRKGCGGLSRYLYVVNPVTDNIPPVNPLLLQLLADTLAETLEQLEPDAVLVPEALGLPLAVLVAQRLARPMIIARKRGYEVEGVAASYASGYEEGAYYVYGLRDEFRRLVLVDDTVSTGGTALALAGLLEKAGREVAAVAAAIAKPQYGGVERLEERGYKLYRIVDLYVAEEDEGRARLRLVGRGILEGLQAELERPILKP